MGVHNYWGRNPLHFGRNNFALPIDSHMVLLVYSYYYSIIPPYCGLCAGLILVKRMGRGAAIVNVSSGASTIGQPLLYSMSKAALNAMQACCVSCHSLFHVLRQCQCYFSSQIWNLLIGILHRQKSKPLGSACDRIFHCSSRWIPFWSIFLNIFTAVRNWSLQTFSKHEMESAHKFKASVLFGEYFQFVLFRGEVSYRGLFFYL